MSWDKNCSTVLEHTTFREASPLENDPVQLTTLKVYYTKSDCFKELIMMGTQRDSKRKKIRQL